MALVFCGLLGGGVAAAQDIRSLGRHGVWDAYAYEEEGGRVCFMSAKPTQQSSNKPKAKRGAAYIYVTHRKGERDVVSVTAGFPPAQPVSLTVDSQSAQLVPDGETAWGETPDKDREIVEAILKGNNATVKATSKHGTVTTDMYSLKGSADAYKAISMLCDE